MCLKLGEEQFALKRSHEWVEVEFRLILLYKQVFSSPDLHFSFCSLSVGIVWNIPVSTFLSFGTSWASPLQASSNALHQTSNTLPPCLFFCNGVFWADEEPRPWLWHGIAYCSATLLLAVSEALFMWFLAPALVLWLMFSLPSWTFSEELLCVTGWWLSEGSSTWR